MSELPSQQELLAWLDAAADVAQSAGTMLRDVQGTIDATAIESKSSPVDLVSSADGDAERLIRAGLAAILPSAGFIGEESPLPDMDAHGLYWCVDPLDGTSNFLCGLPLWAVSIALVTPNLQPQLGVVHAPLLNKLWTAAHGCGTQANGGAVKVRQHPPGGGLHNAMLATGFPYDVTQSSENNNVDYYSIMQRRFQKIRRLGSAAIDLAYVAEGSFDGMWELKLKPWDSAAGLLLVKEAGGLATTLNLTLYTPGDISMVCAGTHELLDLILELIGTQV
ncbi:MAG: inositol monophosphatase [bacterium]|nr:inositol monophosphatase [bacterium]